MFDVRIAVILIEVVIVWLDLPCTGLIHRMVPNRTASSFGSFQLRYTGGRDVVHPTAGLARKLSTPCLDVEMDPCVPSDYVF